MSIKLVENTVYGRYYDIGGLVVPSVTTVVRGGSPMPYFLMKHIIKNSEGDYDKYLSKTSEALRVGSLAHDYCEKLLLGESFEVENDAEVQRALISFCAWYKEYKPKVIATEEILYSSAINKGRLVYPYAGRCDLVAEIDGEIWMIDFKTAKQISDPAFDIQLSMYKNLWDINNPDKIIDKMGVVHCKKNFMGKEPSRNTRLFKEVKYSPKAVDSVVYLFNLYNDSVDKAGYPKTKPSLQTFFKL
tara:strand:+ start:85 stop:819 length:735 start_codon:yes stop_codon:yes gene_type:complete